MEVYCLNVLLQYMRRDINENEHVLCGILDEWLASTVVREKPSHTIPVNHVMHNLI